MFSVGQAVSPPPGAELVRSDPVTPRLRPAARTRRALIASARAVFEEQGYSDTRIEHITARAGYAIGTYYTHFSGKEEVFRHVLDDMLAAVPMPNQGNDVRGTTDAGSASDLLARLERANIRYWRSFPSHRRLWTVFEEATLMEEDARSMVEARWSTYRSLQVQKFECWKSEGLIPSGLDIGRTIEPLAAMTDWLVALQRVYRHKYPIPVRAEMLTSIWALALGLDASLIGEPPARREPRQPTERGAERVAAAVRLGTKAEGTRREIVESARQVFSARGLAETGIRDIVAGADVSVGTFYRYFDSKEQVLEAILRSLGETIRPQEPDGGVRASIEVSNRKYLTEVASNPALWRAIAKTVLTHRPLQAALSARRNEHVTLTATAIARWQRHGAVSAPLEPLVAAATLIAMTERSAHNWYVIDDHPPRLDIAVADVSELWCRVLRPTDSTP